MAKAETNKNYFNFTKGLITEATALTYPENSTKDELNLEIDAKGNRYRRLGMAIEPGGTTINHGWDSTFPSLATTEYRWEAVANQPGFNLLVQQVGLEILFFDMSIAPLNSAYRPYIVDLSPFILQGLTYDSHTIPVEFSAGKGYLFISGQAIQPILVEYDVPTATMRVSQIYITVRDFKGVDDGLANDEEPGTLSSQHRYNLINQGWVDPTNTGGGSASTYYDSYSGQSSYTAPTTTVIDKYFNYAHRYPANNSQWWAGKATEDNGDIKIGDFDPSELQRVYFGNNRAPRGHFIVDAFNVDRSAVSGIAGLPPEVITTRPVTVAFAFGRVWYALNNTCYFSQIIDDPHKVGKCYQDADPTSELISDLVASDGGTIPILEAANIVKLLPLGGSLVVFATNGIWSISGGNGGFSATDISVTKINSIGTDSPTSVVEAGIGTSAQVFWWSRVGIMAMEQASGNYGPVAGRYDQNVLTDKTIRSFYFENIPETAHMYVKGIFDEATSTVQWLYKSDDSLPNYYYDSILNYDTGLGAFYPHKVSEATGYPYICGVFNTQRLNTITDVAGNTTTEIRPTFLKYTVAVPYPGNLYSIGFGYFYDDNFADWNDLPYLSFLETGYELLEDAMRRKQTPYVFVYFRQTEQEVIDNGDGTVHLNHPSSCLMQTKWEWSNSEISNKYGSKVEVYRPSKVGLLTPGPYTSGFSTVVTKNKVRGSGKAIQFRFECDKIGYDFDLLGWAVSYSGVTKP